MSFSRTLSTVGLGLAALTYAGVTNTYRFVTTRHRVRLAALDRPVRIAHLSDLHYGLFVGRGTVRRWVNATLRAKPDLVVITGDFFDSGTDLRDHLRFLGELSRLHAPLGVYAVWGNHDWTSLNTNAARFNFAERLRLHGVHLINNAGVQLREDLYLAGVDDWWFGNQDLSAALSKRRGGATVLLSHNPDYLPHVPGEISLTLSGHTHGGQVRLPLVGPLKRATLLRPLQGWVRGSTVLTSPAEGLRSTSGAGEALGFVSRGLGVTGLPLRWACPAELAVLDLEPLPPATAALSTSGSDRPG